jgi:uncharacterized protein (DUF1499 family)
MLIGVTQKLLKFYDDFKFKFLSNKSTIE